MSRIFRPYRSLGKVCDKIPIVLRYHAYHKEVYIIASVGRCVHTYALQHLAIKSISDEFGEDITALAANNHVILVATGCHLYSLRYARSISRTFRNPGKSTIQELVILDNQYFISVDYDGNVIVWNIEEDEPVIEIMIDSLARFLTTAIMHPISYKNKILMGSNDGRLYLWNIKRNTLIYDFSAAIQEEVGAHSRIAITRLVQGPAAHLVGVGRQDGSVQILHLRSAEVMWKFKQEWGSVSSLTFRRDGVDQLLSGSSKGYVTIWRLEKNSTVGGGKEWHQEAVTGLTCVHRQPLVVSSSPDNHLKVWSYSDSGPNDPDVVPRILYKREGHSLPPTVLRYVGFQGEELLSGGKDSSLRMFSTIHERFNRQFGRAYRRTAKSAAGRKKQRKSLNASSIESEACLYPGFTDLSVESSRSQDWDTIASCHGTLSIATWNFRKGTQGSHHLKSKLFSENPAAYKNTYSSCVSMSSCGHFVTVGYSSGHVIRYNIQSGLERASMMDEGLVDRKAHQGEVTGVCSDLLDMTILTCGGDNEVRSWEAKTGRLKKNLKLDSQPKVMRLHREGEALVVGLANGYIFLINSNTLTIVRRLSEYQCTNETLSELVFFPDAKWLVSFGTYGSVKTWDLIHGKLIDWFKVPKPIVSAAMSPTADFLATVHNDDLGIYLWTNQALYKPLILTPIVNSSLPTVIDLPTSSLRSINTDTDADEIVSDEEKPTSYEQLHEDLITLSNVSESRWRHLHELDTIKQRNKPVAPPKVPKEVPFFMAAVNDTGTFQLNEENSVDTTLEKNDRLLAASISRLRPYLEKEPTVRSETAIVSFLETLGPSAIDLEIQLLASYDDSHEFLINFLDAILTCVRRRLHFDTCQAYLNLVLHHHGLVCSKSERLRKLLKEINNAVDAALVQVQDQMDEVDVMCNLAVSQLPYSE